MRIRVQSNRNHNSIAADGNKTDKIIEKKKNLTKMNFLTSTLFLLAGK